jgi:methyltransferase OMS1
LYGGDRSKRQEREIISADTDDGMKSYVLDPRRTDTFQKIAYSYDEGIEKDELVMGINLLRRALLYFHAKGTVLEVGAGTGRNIGYYPGPSTVRKIVLTDTSDKMLLRAKEKLSKMSNDERERYEVIVADAANLQNYDDNSFDTVVDTFGLCSFDDPVAVLKELKRVCKADGKILLLEHGRSKSFAGLSSYLDKHSERHAKNWGCVWNRDITKIVQSSGLELEKLDTWHFGTTYYIVCRPSK